MAKKKGPTPKRRKPPVMVRCLACGNEEKYPHFGVCPVCGHEYATYS